MSLCQSGSSCSHQLHNTDMTSVYHTICNVSDVVCQRRRQEVPDLWRTCWVLQCCTLARVVSRQADLTPQRLRELQSHIKKWNIHFLCIIGPIFGGIAAQSRVQQRQALAGERTGMWRACLQYWELNWSPGELASLWDQWRRSIKQHLLVYSNQTGRTRRSSKNDTDTEKPIKKGVFIFILKHKLALMTWWLFQNDIHHQISPKI